VPKLIHILAPLLKDGVFYIMIKIIKSKIKKASTDELLKDDTYSYTIEPSNTTDKLSKFMDEYVEFVSINIYKLFPKEFDAKIADAVLELFRKRESIDVFNKKALYIYIHEMIPNVKTPKITKIAGVLYKVFKKNYLFYLDQGYTDFSPLVISHIYTQKYLYE
jgi:hypothetical protein